MKKKKKIYFKILLILLLFFSSFSLISCFNYRDINKLVFVTTVLYDLDEDNNIIVYLEVFKPFRSSSTASEKGQRLLFKGKGKTCLEASRNVNLSSSYIVNYTQNKAIIFTERAAEKGLDRFIDFINRDQEFIIRPNVFIYFGDPEKLMKIKLKDEEYIGIYLSLLIENIGSSSRSLKSTLNDYLVRRNSINKTVVLTGIEIKKESVEDTIILSGGAVIQDDKMVNKINIIQGQAYNFLTNQVRKGTLEVSNPLQPNYYVTLEILKSKTKTSIKYDGTKLYVKKDIYVKTTLAEAQGKFNMTNENMRKLEENGEKNIKKYTELVFQDYKARELDIFMIEQDFHRKYPWVQSKNIIANTELEINVKVYLEGSSSINSGV